MNICMYALKHLKSNTSSLTAKWMSIKLGKIKVLITSYTFVASHPIHLW